MQPAADACDAACSQYAFQGALPGFGTHERVAVGLALGVAVGCVVDAAGSAVGVAVGGAVGVAVGDAVGGGAFGSLPPQSSSAMIHAMF